MVTVVPVSTFAYTTRVRVFRVCHDIYLLNRRVEYETTNIKELVYHDVWSHGTLSVCGAAAPSSLAAVEYYLNGSIQIRVYYQNLGLSLKEYCYNDSAKWFQGLFCQFGITSQV